MGLGGHRGICVFGPSCWRCLQLHTTAGHIDGWIVRINVADHLQSKTGCTVGAFAASLRDNSVAVAIAIAAMEKRGDEIPLRNCGRGHVAAVVGWLRWRFVDSAPSNAAEIQYGFGNGNFRQDLA